ncbi:non-ribosomal peptide synthetase [Salinispora pacifica]|uniref:non-ribosomal peptide synthetase n=1 Tax=Salinispora pacifica TaxID=351187 RepID=UPI00067F6123|nr:non-ribosomal peptide synthetase [Salinispora pacifica]
MHEPATIPALFDEVAQRHADRTALVYQGTTLTYQELQHRADDLADLLNGGGVTTETVVGVYAERSIELVVAFLGVLKAGGTYVCLSPDHPRERLAQILAEAGAARVVTTSQHRQAAEEFGLPVIDIAETTDSGRLSAGRVLSRPVTAPDALAYIIFTSGSTGRPKGVGITHRNLLGLVRDQTYAAFGPEEIYLQLSPAFFDASAFEIWGALLSGARLVVAAASYHALDELPDVLRTEQVTMLLLTPPLFHELVRRQIDAFSTVRRLIVGAEAMSLTAARTYLEHARSHGASFANVYGPTEATTLASCYEITDLERSEGIIPIGSAIDGAAIHLLDEDLNPVAPGATGQIYIGGPGVARGYVGQPGLTARSFVADPYSAVPGARMYATGDLGRRRADGEIEFLGRGDDQVKIRGHRVELGEVEAALARCPGVHAVAVTARSTSVGSHQLVAHLVAQDPQNQRLGRDLAQFAVTRLPAYLRPSAIQLLPDFPLTPSGKIDRKALDARLDEPAPAATPMPTPDDEQSVLTGIWQQILGVDDIGPDDDFFALGGDSLLAIRVIADAEAAGIDIALADLFATPTINGLTGRGASDKSGAAVAVAGATQERPSPVQQRLRDLWAELLGVVPALDDDFFALGGDSLLAIRVIADAEAAGIDIALADLFATPTIRALAPDSSGTPVLAQRSDGHADHTEDSDLTRHFGPEVETVYPATLMQLGLLFESEADPDSGLYIDVISRRIAGRFEEALFTEALRLNLTRHPVLRTGFDLHTLDMPVQLVYAEPAISLTVRDVRGESPDTAAAAVKEDLRAAGLPFAPDDRSLIRFRVTRTAVAEYCLTYGFHHAVMDGWSESVFAGELLRRYDALLRGAAPVPVQPLQGYGDFVALEQQTLQSETARQYWKERCAALAPTLTNSGEGRSGTDRRTLTAVVPQDVAAGLRHGSRQWRLPYKSLLVAGHLAALGRILGTAEPVTGLIVNGRPQATESDQMVGLFLNVVPVSAPVTGSWREIAGSVFEEEKALLPHRRFPYPALRELMGTQLFDVAFNYVQFHRSARLLELKEVRVLDTRIEDKTSFPLAFDVVQSPDGEQLTIEAAATADTFSAAHLEAVVAAHLDVYREMAADALTGEVRRSV